MKLGRTILTVATAAAISLGGALFLETDGNNTSILSLFATSVAEAKDGNQIRHPERRTVRRVERRHQYHRVLPRGCSTVILRGQRFWFCGGLYYQQVLNGGQTVYVIVTP